MAEALPVICVFGLMNVELESSEQCAEFETLRLDSRCYLTDDNLYEVLAKERPSVIVSFGDTKDYPNLMASPWDIRKRWLNFAPDMPMPEVGRRAFACYMHNALNKRNEFPLVTVFTPAYKTGDKIMRPFDSLRAQSYRDWEWVIIDDSDDNGETFKMLTELANRDYRIRVYKESRHSGCIGRLKKNACLLGRGEYLVEMDHDDELTTDALANVVKAFQTHKDCGFVYTDFAECFEDGSPVSYGQNKSLKPPFTDWGFGYGSYRQENHGGHDYMVVNAPNINPKTIRHIVAAPNHIRAWRATTYNEIGGHGDYIHVADDYEIMVRTFLATRMCRVPVMCYVQYRNFGVGNTHQSRNREIQRLVRSFSQWYDKRIHERFLELGVDDFVWKDGEDTFCRMGHIPNQPEESHCTVLMESA